MKHIKKLKISEGTSKSNYCRAKRKLKKLLEDYLNKQKWKIQKLKENLLSEKKIYQTYQNLFVTHQIHYKNLHHVFQNFAMVLNCLLDSVIPTCDVPVVHKWGLVGHGLKYPLHDSLKRCVAVLHAHGHHLPLPQSARRDQGWQGSGFLDKGIWEYPFFMSNTVNTFIIAWRWQDAGDE